MQKRKEIIKKLLTTLLIFITSGSVTFSVCLLGQERKVTITTNLELSETEEPQLVKDIDGGKIADIENLSDEEKENAVRGYTVGISTPKSFIDATWNQCIYLNNPYGSQCYNTTALLMENQVGYYPSTCGTGGAKGIWDCRDYNARGDGITHYDLIYNPEELREGDIWVSHNGEYGHTGMVAGNPFWNGGVLYVPLYSTNQGGKNCEYGGQATNIINISVSTFSGALRWTGWNHLFEQPDNPIPISNCHFWNVEQGDTMGKIMMNCENTLHYGEIMDEYAKTWFSTIIKPNQSVYDGWHSESGVGLYADDTIEKRNN